MLSVTLALVLAAEPMELVVWGGGKTPEAAQASLAELTKRGGEWSGYLTLAKGYPKVVDSAKVEGLNPGFHIVVLGACFEPDVPEIVSLFKIFEPAVYQKTVKWPDGDACPASSKTRVSNVQRVKTAGGELAAIVVSSGGEDFWKSETITRFQKKGAAPVVQTFENEDCSGGELEVLKGSLSYVAKCVTGRCTTFGHDEVRFTYGVKGDGVDEVKKRVRTIDKTECD